MMFGEPVFWRDTKKPAKLLIFDVRTALALRGPDWVCVGHAGAVR